MKAAVIAILAVATFWMGHQSSPPAPARIGQYKVPIGTQCQEDEAIVLMGTSTPVCVNVGDLVASR